MQTDPTKTSLENSVQKDVIRKQQPNDSLGLEDIVLLANKIGLEFSDAKHELDKLEMMRPTVKSRISLEIYNQEKVPEAMLRRMTETHPEYTDYLEQILEAKTKAEKLRIRYDSYKNLFDAKRSLLSYQKAEMSLL